MQVETAVQEFLQAADPAIAGQLLNRLVFEFAEPLIRQTVWDRLSTLATRQDCEDVSGGAALELSTRLQAARQPGAEPVANLQAYAAVTAHRACDSYLRRRWPNAHRYRERLRYLLENTRGLITWETSHGELVCGLVDHRGKPPAALSADWFHGVAIPAGANEITVVQVLIESASPISFEDVFWASATILNVPGVSSEWSGADQSAGIAERQHMLGRLWTEIQELPVPQRRVLLLNLRDGDGASPLAWLPASGIATFREIAFALEIGPADFAALWRGLPLSEPDLAARMGLSRQQVLQLRTAGRQELGRRLAAEAPGFGQSA